MWHKWIKEKDKDNNEEKEMPIKKLLIDVKKGKNGGGGSSHTHTPRSLLTIDLPVLLHGVALTLIIMIEKLIPFISVRD